MVSRGGALVLSREAKAKMRGIVRGLSEERKMFIRENERQAMAREEEKRRVEVRCRRYMRLMRKGFFTLTALACSATMRKFFRVANRGFFFYGLGDPYNTSPIIICLFPDRIEVTLVHGWPCSTDEFVFPFNAPKKYEAWISGEISRFKRVDFGRIGRGDENYAADVLIEDYVLSIIRDCADSKKFGEYLADALKANR